MHPGLHMTSAQMVDKLQERVEVVEEIGGEIGVDTNLVEDDLVAYLKEIAVEPTDVNNTHTTKAHSCSR